MSHFSKVIACVDEFQHIFAASENLGHLGKGADQRYASESVDDGQKSIPTTAN